MRCSKAQCVVRGKCNKYRTAFNTPGYIQPVNSSGIQVPQLTTIQGHTICLKNRIYNISGKPFKMQFHHIHPDLKIRSIHLDCNPTVKGDDMVPTQKQQRSIELISQKSIIQSCELPYMNGHHKRAYLL